MIGCRCKVGDGLSRAVLITRKLSGVVLSPHAKKAVMEKPRNVGGAFLRPCARLTVRGFSKLAQVKEFKPAFPEISFNLITGATKATQVVCILKNELRWL